MRVVPTRVRHAIRGDQEELMAVANPRDLFFYELSGMHDEEREGAVLRADMIDQIRDVNLQQVMRVEHQECQQRMKNLDLCFHALGSRPRQVASVVVDGMHADYQRFLSLEPSSVAVDMYTFGCAMNLARFGIGSYKALVDKSILMGMTQCAQVLQSNLVMNMESAGRMQRVNHEISQRIMAAA
jgi:ferritin-like metal-binding protein YciE